MNNGEEIIERQRVARAQFAAQLLGSPSAERSTLPQKHVFVPAITAANTVGYGTFNYDSLSDVFAQLQNAAIRPYLRGSHITTGTNLVHDLYDYRGIGDQHAALREEIARIFISGGTIKASTLRHIEPDLGQLKDPVIEWRDYKKRVALDAIASWFKDSPPFLSHVESRLADLIVMATEEYPETDIPNVTAIGLFAEFVQRVRVRRAPRIGLTPGGHIVAEWGPSDGRRAALQFLPDTTINFSARIPDPAKGGRSMPIYGATSLAALYQRIQNDPALSWITLDESDTPTDTE
jgi:hypothetical protein